MRAFCACGHFTVKGLAIVTYSICRAYHLCIDDILNALSRGRMPYYHELNNATLTYLLLSVFDTADSQYYTQDDQ